MVGGVDYNERKIRSVGKREIFDVLAEISRKSRALKRQFLFLRDVHLNHEKFLQKLDKLGEKGLTEVLKRLGFFGSDQNLSFLEKKRLRTAFLEHALVSSNKS